VTDGPQTKDKWGFRNPSEETLNYLFQGTEWGTGLKMRLLGGEGTKEVNPAS